MLEEIDFNKKNDYNNFDYQMNRYIFADIFDFSWHKKKMEEQNKDKLPRCQFPECYHPIKIVDNQYGQKTRSYKGKFCLLHSCYHEDCLYMVSKYNNVCLYHVCSYTDCNNWLDTSFSLSYRTTPSMEFCDLHTCREKSCTEPVMNDKYFCYQHVPITYAEMNEKLTKKRKSK